MVSRYTNAVLTVIAVCLTVLVFQPIFAPGEVLAQPVPEERAAAPAATPEHGAAVDVNIVSIAGWKLLQRSALPVEIESSNPVPVEVRGPICSCP